MNSDVRSDDENTGNMTDRTFFRREGTITAVLMNAVRAALFGGLYRYGTDAFSGRLWHGGCGGASGGVFRKDSGGSGRRIRLKLCRSEKRNRSDKKRG